MHVSAVETIFMIKYCNQDMYIPLCINIYVFESYIMETIIHWIDSMVKVTEVTVGNGDQVLVINLKTGYSD
jgi:hypothetical protein